MSLINEFSIQLYSVREETNKDFIGTLEKLSQIGYTGVEFAGYGNISAKEMKDALDKYNLKSIGSHISLERLENNLEEEIEYNKVLDTKYIICPFYDFKTKDDIIQFAQKINPIAKKLQSEGFAFGYHNHSHEFEKIDDQYILDILFENLDKEYSIMELDLYWAAYAEVDYIKYIKKYADRIKILHLKQIQDKDTKKCVDLDKGIIDFKEIITIAQEANIQEFMLEQEEFEIDAFTSVKNGFNHIMSL